MLQLDESANGHECALSVGQVFELRLPENRTTGYSWSVITDGEPICALIGDAFDAADGAPGSGGSHHWQFLTERVGAGTIRLIYNRIWEHEKPPARSMTLFVVAQAALKDGADI